MYMPGYYLDIMWFFRQKVHQQKKYRQDNNRYYPVLRIFNETNEHICFSPRLLPIIVNLTISFFRLINQCNCKRNYSNNYCRKRINFIVTNIYS